MAKLYINKNITREAQKAFEWWFTGDTGISYKDVNEFIGSIPADDERLDVELYSCGGDCTEGFAIYDALRTCGKILTTTVVGEAASMATVIMLAAPKESRRAYKHARFLIHEPYFPDGVCGDVTLERLDSLKQALDGDRQKIVDIYVERTETKERKILEQMADGNWFDTERAQDLGFISEIVPETAAAAKTPRVSFTIKTGEQPLNNKDMLNKKDKEGVFARAKEAFAKALGLDEHAADLELTATDGTVLTIDSPDGEIQVGQTASPDGTYTLPDDGRVITIAGGVITDIQEPEDNGGEQDADDPDNGDNGDLQKQVDDLKKQVEELQKQVEELQSNQKTAEDKEVLEAVNRIGGIKALKKLPVGKANIPAQPAAGQGERDYFQEMLNLNKK